MLFAWLKHYMPRSLYGRAAFILVMPVVVMLLVVSTAFLQRHLEDVTRQMTWTVAREIRMIQGQVDDVETQPEFLARLRPDLAALEMQLKFVQPEDVPAEDQLRWFDYTGAILADEMRNRVDGIVALDMPDDRLVHLFIGTDLGLLDLSLNRRRFSPAAPHQLIVTMVFFGFLMTAISFLYLRNQLRPITRLARAAQAFGRGRTLPYSPSGAVEVRQAGHAFIDMRARIERQIEQRTLMLSGVSHDLRTPLTRLKLGLAMLDEEDARPLLRDVDEMQKLVDAFLDFSRGTAEGPPKQIDPLALVRDIVSDAQRSGKPVTLGDCTGEGTIALRPMAIRRAIENLLGNAVRYGSNAVVSAKLTEKSLRIRVEDDGPGIAADQRGEAVKPFSRLDPARNQNQGTGVGLGLAIVADVARAHGGTLRLGKSAKLGGLCADIVVGR